MDSKQRLKETLATLLQKKINQRQIYLERLIDAQESTKESLEKLQKRLQSINYTDGVLSLKGADQSTSQGAYDHSGSYITDRDPLVPSVLLTSLSNSTSQNDRSHVLGLIVDLMKDIDDMMYLASTKLEALESSLSRV